jgi:hypothetical protein
MDLPIVVGAARAWLALFPCELGPLRALVPPPLEPVGLRSERGVVVAALFDFEESSIGSFRELAVGFAVRYRPWLSLPFGAMLLERRATDFGWWLQVVSVSTEAAREAAVRHWGLAAFVGDVQVLAKRARLRASLTEGGHEVLGLEMKRPGPGMPMHFPFRVYSRLGSDVLRSDSTVDAIGREKSLLASAKLVLHRHERVEGLRALNIALTSPMQVRWYDAYRTRLEGPAARYRLK